MSTALSNFIFMSKNLAHSLDTIAILTLNWPFLPLVFLSYVASIACNLISKKKRDKDPNRETAAQEYVLKNYSDHKINEQFYLCVYEQQQTNNMPSPAVPYLSNIFNLVPNDNIEFMRFNSKSIFNLCRLLLYFKCYERSAFRFSFLVIMWFTWLVD